VRVELAAEPDEAWLAGYRYRGAGLPPGAREVLLGADEPVFAAVRSAPAPAPLDAVGRGAVAGRWLVLTALTVAEAARRRGLATAVTAALAAWATGRGASSCLLQVAADNAPALALYARLGFTEHHRYWYRSAP
jgi:ribosomal protein S18 acetylase RimI-like enzyme